MKSASAKIVLQLLTQEQEDCCLSVPPDQLEWAEMNEDVLTVS
jgi:hypothetical protein